MALDRNFSWWSTASLAYAGIGHREPRTMNVRVGLVVPFLCRKFLLQLARLRERTAIRRSSEQAKHITDVNF
jgi:hypothetical protein